jgi:hypothetical protein
MSILAFQKLWLKCKIFHEIIKQIRLIDHYFLFIMTFRFKYDLKLSIFHRFSGIIDIFLEINYTLTTLFL